MLYIVRASFGVALVTSSILIFTTILVLLTSTDKNSSSHIFLSSVSSSNILGNTSFSLFYYYINNPYGRSRYLGHNSSMSFLEAAFYFHFGNGNPNAGLEACSTRTIAEAVAPPRDCLCAPWRGEDVGKLQGVMLGAPMCSKHVGWGRYDGSPRTVHAGDG